MRTHIEIFVALSAFFALTYLINEIGNLFFAISNRNELEGWVWQLAGRILELFLGIALISNPEVSMIILAFFVGFWLLFRGIATISMSIELKKVRRKGMGLDPCTGDFDHGVCFSCTGKPIVCGIFSDCFCRTLTIFLRNSSGFDLTRIEASVKRHQGA